MEGNQHKIQQIVQFYNHIFFLQCTDTFFGCGRECLYWIRMHLLNSNISDRQKQCKKEKLLNVCSNILAHTDECGLSRFYLILKNINFCFCIFKSKIKVHVTNILRKHTIVAPLREKHKKDKISAVDFHSEGNHVSDP